MEFSKRAIWLAVNSEHGDRLVQIAAEHISITRQLIEEGKRLPALVVNKLKTRIEELRTERDAILARFEGR